MKQLRWVGPTLVLGALMAGVASNTPVTDLLRADVAAAGPPTIPTVFISEQNDDTPAELRHMPPQLPPAFREHRELPRKLLPGREGTGGPSAPDPVLQTWASGALGATNGIGFDGVSNVNGVLPPDTNGDVGPNHYVQTVNLAFAVWNKAGVKVYPTSGTAANINTLWSGFGGPCQTRNDGDPIVLYDRLADRWLIAQFALPSFPIKPFYICIAVSKTPAPTGAWHRYAFKFDKMPDYLKFGVWGDAYYMSINQFKSGSLGWGGQGVVAFERSRMLAGLSARGVMFDLYNVDRNVGGLLPSHLSGGLTPPDGTANTFATFDDDSWGYSADQIQLWDFKVNWTTPTASTFTKVAVLSPAALDSNLCGYARNCIPQKDTTVKVDALSDRLMYRLNYRKFLTHEAVVVTHTVDIDGSNRAGSRWYELRKTAGVWSINQQGTYVGPGTDNRWMASIAMNKNGTIALGFSVSGANTYPSIGYTGRLAADTPGAMTQGEGVLIAGTGFQTHSSGRWGDYASMSVDPTDDCTFWFTSEYYLAASSSAGWRTRVGSFTLESCS